ncbi:MAG: CRTAC1 family protein, partial [Flavobacteriales bacterium]
GNLGCVGGDDDSGPGYSSITSMNVTGGTTYYIAWDSYWSSAGFTFSLSVSDPVVNLLNFTATSAPVGANAILDMNADYLDDLVGVSGDNMTISYQQPDGTFSTQTLTIADGVANAPSWSICGGDLDGNGFNDLLFAGGGGASFIWANDAGTAYNETSDGNYIFCQRSNLVDMNADGNLDAFVCHDVAPNIWYMNNGTQLFDWNQGGLGDTPDGGNYGSVWIDYDNDCDIDMFIAKCRGGNTPANINQMHRNNGDGTFTEVGEEIGLADNVQTWSSAWADYDNDGDMDVVVGASSFTNGGHKVMINDGTGNFTNQTTGSGFDSFVSTGIEWAPADFNNDGYVDVIGAGNTVMVNNGDLTFTPSLINFGVGPMGDINNDGFIDVVTGGTAYMNVPNGNNYITLNMRGTVSNKNGIGARVTLYTPTGQQIRDIRSGEGFRYMSTLNGHFGIGQDTQIDSIRVCWPSGLTDRIVAPGINQNLVIIEGENVVNVVEIAENNFDVFP